MKKSLIFFFLFIFVILLNFGCRGKISKKPPIHLNPNMDQQQKCRAYSENNFFADKRNMRAEIEGTISRGNFFSDEFSKGIKNGNFLNYFPKEITLDLNFLKEGKKNFEIFCSPCHSKIGDGTGTVSEFLPIKAPSFYTDYFYNLSVGYLYNVINNGIRSMLGYSDQIQIKERWGIVAYIKILQLSKDYNNLVLIDNIKNIFKEKLSNE